MPGVTRRFNKVVRAATTTGATTILTFIENASLRFETLNKNMRINKTFTWFYVIRRGFVWGLIMTNSRLLYKS